MCAWSAPFGHSGRIFGLAFHPQRADVIASASEDETVRVWSRDSSGTWQQTDCCRGHTSEVLRVAWSPDGRLLASGSADHTVRFWSVSTDTNQQSYSGNQLGVLSGHPEEVYAVSFLPDAPTASSNHKLHHQQQQQVQHAAHRLASSSLCNAAAAAAAGGSSGSDGSCHSSNSSSVLLAASGESLYLWDLAAGQLLQQSAPLPVLKASPQLAAALLTGSTTQQQQQQRQAGKQQQQQQQQQSLSKPATTTSSSSTSEAGPGPSSQQAAGFSDAIADGEGLAEDGSEEGLEEPPPSYIFSMAVCAETLWAAACCSDGMVRLWDAGRRGLCELGAVQVHAGQMCSVVSWLPQQPLVLSSISKQGQLVLQDVRLLGRPLLQQQLVGPVYDAAWVQGGWATAGAAGAAAAAAGAAAGGGDADAAGTAGTAANELQLVAVGRDKCLRAYALNTAALQQGQLPLMGVLPAPCGFSGSLLAVAASADGRRLAAAGEAVEAGSLRPLQQQQQQQHMMQQQQQQQHMMQQQQQQQPEQEQGQTALTAHAAAAIAAGTAAAATAAVGGGDGQGRGSMPVVSGKGAAAAAAAAATAAAAAARRGRNRRSAAVDLLALSDGRPSAAQQHDTADLSMLPNNWQATDAATAAAAAGGSSGSGGHGGGAHCAAASAGVLLRAPLFVLSG